MSHPAVATDFPCSIANEDSVVRVTVTSLGATESFPEIFTYERMISDPNFLAPAKTHRKTDDRLQDKVSVGRKRTNRFPARECLARRLERASQY